MGAAAQFANSNANPMGPIASKLNQTNAGKLVQLGTGGVEGATQSLMKGQNPIANTPVGQIASKLGAPAQDTNPGPVGAGVAPSSSSDISTDPNSIKSLLSTFMPAYQSPLGANGQLQSQYNFQKAGQATTPTINQPGNLTAATTTATPVDNTALNDLSSYAESNSPSPWANMAQQANTTNTQQQLSTAADAANGSAASSRDQLAMNGGLSSGAAERIASGASRASDASQQAINAQSGVNASNINLQDQSNKLQTLQQIPGMNLANANYTTGVNEANASNTNATNQFNNSMAYNTNVANAGNALNASEFNTTANNNAAQFNVSNTLAANQGQNAYNAYFGGQGLAGYGAAMSGNAIQNGGSGGSLG